MKYFSLVWAGLWRKRTRTIFTMLSVVVAFLLFGLLQGFNQGINYVVENQNVNRLFISAKSGMTDGLPIAHMNRIGTVPGVKAVSHWTYFGGFFRNSKDPLPAFATNADQLFAIYKEVKIKPEYLDAMRNTRNGVIVSDAVAKARNWKIGDRIPVGTSIWTKKDGGSTWEFQIVGTFDTSKVGQGFPGFYLNYDYFDEASAFGHGIIHYYLVSIDDPRRATRISQEIDALFANSSDETLSQTESAMALQILKQFADINFIANAIVGAVMFTLLFLTANTMMQSVRERTSELAVLKTFGFSDGKVLALVLAEALLLCLFAAAIGLALGRAVFALPSIMAIFGSFPVPLKVPVMGAGLALLLALMSGLPPAWRARQLNIVDALAGR